MYLEESTTEPKTAAAKPIATKGSPKKAKHASPRNTVKTTKIVSPTRGVFYILSTSNLQASFQQKCDYDR